VGSVPDLKCNSARDYELMMTAFMIEALTVAYWYLMCTYDYTVCKCDVVALKVCKVL